MNPIPIINNQLKLLCGAHKKNNILKDDVASTCYTQKTHNTQQKTVVVVVVVVVIVIVIVIVIVVNQSNIILCTR